MTMTTARPRITTAKTKTKGSPKFRIRLASPIGICPECEGAVPLNTHKKIDKHGVFVQGPKFEYETKTQCTGKSKPPLTGVLRWAS